MYVPRYTDIGHWAWDGRDRCRLYPIGRVLMAACFCLFMCGGRLDCWCPLIGSGLWHGGGGGVFRPRCANTTYRVSDYAAPSGEFGVPLHHPRFLEWIGVPESASLLKMGSGRWLDALSREKAMAAAIQLHRDVCLMTTNLDILEQYALSLQGTASKMLETSLGCSDFPAADVAAGAVGPRVLRASIQMEAMGLWQPSLDPIRLTSDI